MKISILFIAIASLSLAGCRTYDDSTARTSNVGRGSVAGLSSNWSAQSGGYGPVSRDSGSTIRGGGVGAGTGGSTAVGWIAPGTQPR
jgi:hypothetical protein